MGGEHARHQARLSRRILVGVSDIWKRLEALPDVANPADAKAAVLLPLYDDDEGTTRIILTKRPDFMRTHPGDIVFPGGRIEPGEHPAETAMREAWEEIRLPIESVTVVGGLSAMTTRDPSNWIIPVVGRVVRPDVLVPDEREVESIIEPELVELFDEDRWVTRDFMGYDLWFFEFDEGVMWGATAFIFREFLTYVR